MSLRIVIFLALFQIQFLFGQEHQQVQTHDNTTDHQEDSHATSADESEVEELEYDPSGTILHHIADANEWRFFGNVTIPLPVMIYNQDHKNWFISNSAKFHPDSHGNGTTEVDGYEMVNSRIVPVDHSKYIDFSITKNVAALLITAVIMLIVFFAVKRGYVQRPNQAPRGIQGFFEPIIQFVRDTIAKPSLGKHTDKYLPFLLTLFFFIWIANMLGQIAPISSPNLTGNISVTFALALITFFVINLNGTKYYWKHIFDPMGNSFPLVGKIFIYPILVPIEFLGIFIKPAALMIRLFANITAGHIIILSLVALIFVFGNAGQSVIGSTLGALIAIPFSLFVGVIELLVAFLQAFIFTMLASVFIGMAIQTGH